MLRLLTLAVLLAVPGVAAQTPVDGLAEALGLDRAQVRIAEDVYRPGDPGMGWTLAARLAPTLTETQRSRLLATPRDARRTRGTADRRSGLTAADESAARSARDAALGLNTRTSAALDAALSADQSARGADGLTPRVAELLTDEQEELVRMQRGLVRLLHRPQVGARQDRDAARERARSRTERSTRQGAREQAQTRRERTTRQGARDAAQTRREREARQGARDAAQTRQERTARQGARDAAQARREAEAREAAREAARRRSESRRDGAERDGALR